MTRSASRYAGIAGLSFTLATVAGFSLQPALDFDASATAFAAALSDGKDSLLLSGVFMALAAVALTWFLAALGRVLDPGGEHAASAVLAPAGAAAGALLAFGFLSVGALAAWAPEGGADAASLQAVGRLANAATNIALLPLAAAGLAVVAHAQAGRAPVWAAGVGVVASVLSVVAAGRAVDELGFLALLLWLIWAAGLAIGLLRREREPKPALSAA